MTTKDLLLDHLERTFEQEAWQPSLSMAADGLTAAQAAWTPAPQRHSIWQIVRHIIHWKQAVVDAWDGRAPDKEALHRTDWAEVLGDDAAWQADVRLLHAVSAEIRKRVRSVDDDALEGRVATYQGAADQALAVRLTRMATHDAYHAGQIRYLRALQGI